MMRAIAVLLVLLLGLVAWEQHLQGAEDQARAASPRVRRLLTAEQRQGWNIAAVSTITAQGEDLFGRAEGSWRCLTRGGAPVDEQALQALLEALTNAEGLVIADKLADASRFGFEPGVQRRLTLHGPKVISDPQGDRLLAVEIGAALEESQGCFVRLVGTQEIWSIDDNLRARIEPRGAQPALLDPQLVRASWPGQKSGLTRIQIERAGSERLELVRQSLELAPEALAAGAIPFQWRAGAAAGSELLAPELCFAYAYFLLRVPWSRLLDPQQAASFGFSTPRAQLVLESSGVAPLTLVVGSNRGPGGGLALWNRDSGVLFELEPALEALLLPTLELLRAAPAELPLAPAADGSRPNPWDEWLRAHAAPPGGG